MPTFNKPSDDERVFITDHKAVSDTDKNCLYVFYIVVKGSYVFEVLVTRIIINQCLQILKTITVFQFFTYFSDEFTIFNSYRLVSKKRRINNLKKNIYARSCVMKKTPSLFFARKAYHQS